MHFSRPICCRLSNKHFSCIYFLRHLKPFIKLCTHTHTKRHSYTTVRKRKNADKFKSTKWSTDQMDNSRKSEEKIWYGTLTIFGWRLFNPKQLTVVACTQKAVRTHFMTDIIIERGIMYCLLEFAPHSGNDLDVCCSSFFFIIICIFACSAPHFSCNRCSEHAREMRYIVHFSSMWFKEILNLVWRSVHTHTRSHNPAKCYLCL